MPQRIIRAKKSTNSGIASATTALAQNSARLSYSIQNCGTNPLFVKEGASASTSDFSYILAAGTGNDNGTGAKYESPSGQVYSGVITIAGTSPRYVIVERTENDNAN
jgi:hypothetical protein